MKIKAILNASVILTLFLTYCTKEEEFTDNQLISSTEGKHWVISQIIADTTDVTDNLADCVLDNERVFYSDNTYEITEGDTICTITPSQAASGSWEFNSIKTMLKIGVGTDTTEYIIRELQQNRMQLFFIDQKEGVQYTWVMKTK